MTHYDDVVLADEPALYWRMDEDAGPTIVDASGFGRHGTYRGSPSFGGAGPMSCTEPGDQAVLFDGNGADATADYAYRATSPVSGPGDFTHEVWIRPEPDAFTRPGRRYMNLIQQRGDVGVEGYESILRVFTNIEGALGTPTGFGVMAGSSSPLIVGTLEPLYERSGCWSMVTVTRTGSTVRLYLNAQLLGSGASGFSLTAANLSFGGDHPDVSRIGAEEQELFRGRMARAAVYPHALAFDRIAERWDAGCTACGEKGWGIRTVPF